MKVEAYFQKQKFPQKEICQQLRTIILSSFPSIKEEMKWGRSILRRRQILYCFVKRKGQSWILDDKPLKRRTTTLWGARQMMKVITVHSIDKINEDQIVDLLKLV